MATQWGRKETIVWQPHMPIYSYAALATAFVCAVVFLWENYAFQQNPLQKAYFTEYIRATVGDQTNQHGKYRLVTLYGPSAAPRLALPVDFVPGTTLLPRGASLPFMLSPEARAHGYDVFIRAQEKNYADKSMHRWLQFTAPSRELGVANRDLATIDRIYDGRVTAKLDGRDQVVTFQADKMRHFDHGYAVTSHSSQGVTADRVLVNMDTRAHPELINTRFAYVSVSRASQDAQIYTNDAAALGQRLSHDASKSSAVDFRHQPTPEPERKEKKMDNDAQHGFRPENSSREATKERIYTPAEHERHYAPINRELHADDARQFGWVQENGTVQSYQHTGTHRHIHIDGPSGQFYDQQKNAITQQAALDRAMGAGNHHAPEPAKVQEAVQQQRVDQSIGFGL